MADYQPFPIQAEKTGLNNYLQPWIRPEDAFEPLNNAQVYRGVLSKRNGYALLATVADTNPIMGIMRYQNESTGAENLVVASTKAAYLFVDGSSTFSPLVTVGGASSIFWQGTATGTITMPTFWPNFANGPGTISITDGTTTVSFASAIAGVGAMTGAGGIFASGSIVYATGVVTLTFAGTTTGVSLTISGTLATPTLTTGYFTGNITNFFNWVNWQPTDPTTFVSSVSYLYMTNDVDPITLFDGTSLSRPILYVNSAKTDYIKTAFDVKVYRNRLLAILPTLNSTSNPLNQSIYWSAQFNPFNFNNDVAGNGGQLTAATSDIMQSFKFLRDSCIVRFTRSIWIFRFTGNDFNPFLFNRISVTKTTNCPYGSVEYDERETGIGSTGITACDGVNLQRFDINIIDFYETEMSEQFYGQAFSQRYDNNSETWTMYVSQANANPLVGGVAPGSDKALIYNFVEQTWATYVWSVPMTCLGIYHVVAGKTWAQMTYTWQSQDNAWFSYSNQTGAPNLLAGDTSGNVYWMDNEFQTTDNGNPIIADLYTTRWNPFVKMGQKVQFGWIDFYYQRNDDCEITLTFYVDNSDNPSATRTLTLDANGTDGRVGSESAMKRIYINAMGEFLQMELTSSTNATFQINGMILWARPAGRLTP